MAGALPLQGTCSRLVPVMLEQLARHRATHRCPRASTFAGAGLGVGDEFLHGLNGWPRATSRLGTVATREIGAKSFTGSAGIFLYRAWLMACPPRP